MNEDIRKNIVLLCNRINELNIEYYVNNNPSISDYEYDHLYNELLILYKSYPQLFPKDNPIITLGSDLSEGFKKFRHSTPMLSIKNALDIDELKNWLKDKMSFTISAEEKVDGLSLSLIYKNGELVKAVTRGDGEEGDIVTDNAKMIINLPIILSKNYDYEIRGEVYIDKENFKELNKNNEYKNARNLASGTMKLHNSTIVYERKLKFKAHELISSSNQKLPVSHVSRIQYLSELNFDTCNTLSRFFNPPIRTNDIDDFIQACILCRNDLNFDIDGIVFKIDSYDVRKHFTSTSKYHNWQVAYKFPQPVITSKLLSVDHQVGRTGIITPVANIEPTEILGTTVKRATLHNYHHIREKDICINDIISLEKGGEIIPKIVGVYEKAEQSKRIIIEKPYRCPVCNSKVELITNEMTIFMDDIKLCACSNYLCKSRILGRLEHFVSKDGFNIKGLGPSIIKKLYGSGFINDVYDIFTLGDWYESLVEIEKFGEKSVENLLEEIETKLIIPFNKFIYSLGIPGIGKTNAKLLAKIFGNIDNMYSYFSGIIYDDYENSYYYNLLNNTERIGDKTIDKIQEFFDTEGSNIIDELLNLESLEILDYYEETTDSNHFLLGKTVVISGTLSKPRDEIKQYLESIGAKITGSISKNTDYLLLGENPGSKYEKALNLNVKIIKEGDLW